MNVSSVIENALDLGLEGIMDGRLQGVIRVSKNQMRRIYGKEETPLY